CIQSDLKADQNKCQKRERPPRKSFSAARIHECKAETQPTGVAQPTANRIQPGRNCSKCDGDPHLRPKRGCRDRRKQRAAQPGAGAAKNDQRGETSISDECGLMGQHEKIGAHAINTEASFGSILGDYYYHERCAFFPRKRKTGLTPVLPRQRKI